MILASFEKLRRRALSARWAPTMLRTASGVGPIGPSADCHRPAAATAAYATQNVAVNNTKRFRHEQDFEVLGTHCAGRRGTVATHIDKRQHLSLLCLNLLKQRSATKELLECFVGEFLQPFYVLPLSDVDFPEH